MVDRGLLSCRVYIIFADDLATNVATLLAAMVLTLLSRDIKASAPEGLTNWGRDKMAAIHADNILKRIFLNENSPLSIKISLNNVPSNWQESSIDSDNSLAPNRRQAIIWTNDYLDWWCIYASAGINGLRLGPCSCASEPVFMRLRMGSSDGALNKNG